MVKRQMTEYSDIRYTNLSGVEADGEIENMTINLRSSTGIGEPIGRTPIEEPTAAEIEAIHEEFEEVVSTATGTLHPLDANGEPVCSISESHGTTCWSKPKPIAAYPPGFKPVCKYCIEVWRRSR